MSLEPAMAAMVTALSHRGPDADGQLRQRNCLLGHTRLQIIDPVGGVQPMEEPTDRLAITFNGEIYNHRDIARELRLEGVSLRTTSDTEALLLAYRQWGEDCLQKLNGQFAFAIWDQAEQSLFAARDRMGEKPLFYALAANGQLIIASEIKAIVASGLIQPEVDPDAIAAYLHLNYVPADRTIYSNVHVLPAAHQLRWRDGQLTVSRYWDFELSTVSMDEQEAVQEVQRLIAQAVERQMVADTEVGAFLSGGLDSSTIVGLMTPHSERRIKTFAVGFGDLINELPYARDVAQTYQTEHHELQMSIDVAEMLQVMAQVYDQPFGDSSNIPTYLISQFARRHCKVVLSGDGGDELFGGYSWYRHLMLRQGVGDSLGQQVLYKAMAELSMSGNKRTWRARATAVKANRKGLDLWQDHLQRLGAGTGIDPLLNRPGSSGLSWAANHRPVDDVRGIDRAVDFDLRCYLPGDIFTKVDRAAMAHGLETRAPLMDVDLVQFVLRLPRSLRFQTTQSLKPLLRQSCQHLWPSSIVGRDKQGFGAPIRSWLQQPAVSQQFAAVCSSTSALSTYLPGLQSQRESLSRHPQLCWNLLCLGLWLERIASAATIKKVAA
ncbi:MAG: asparagine synthase (glutamine-hydrolyzing) [Rhodopirellula sp. TMED11]|nr:MAG: asparagine synthase (glutamine-hydrolyzing) [Rhodopirellula sp. TMED11]